MCRIPFRIILEAGCKLSPEAMSGLRSVFHVVVQS
jgi:hypothetical protein